MTLWINSTYTEVVRLQCTYQSGTVQPMKLGSYLTAVDKSPEWFAARIGVDPVTVRRYLSGSRRPEWDVIAVIMEVTGGVVTANDFVPPCQKTKTARAMPAPPTVPCE